MVGLPVPEVQAEVVTVRFVKPSWATGVLDLFRGWLRLQPGSHLSSTNQPRLRRRGGGGGTGGGAGEADGGARTRRILLASVSQGGGLGLRGGPPDRRLD